MEVLVINYSFSRWWDCFLYPGTKRGLRNSGSPYSQEVYELAISTFGYKSLGTVDGVSSFPKFQRLKYPKSSNPTVSPNENRMGIAHPQTVDKGPGLGDKARAFFHVSNRI